MFWYNLFEEENSTNSLVLNQYLVTISFGKETRRIYVIMMKILCGGQWLSTYKTTIFPFDPYDLWWCSKCKKTIINDKKVLCCHFSTSGMPFEEEINHQHKFEMRFPWNRILIHKNDIDFAIFIYFCDEKPCFKIFSEPLEWMINRKVLWQLMDTFIMFQSN